MNQLSLLILFLFLMFFHAAALSPSRRSSLQQDAATNFEPSVAIAIAILALVFSLAFLLLAYVRFCRRGPSVRDNEQTLDRGNRLGSQFSGVDKTVIESLPFFRFSSLRGSREGLECAVCLSRFEDVEVLRLLPKCRHAFHINCIDLWLERHSSCPLCRHKISAEDLASLTYSSSLRFLSGHSELREDSNIELFVRREEEEEEGLHGGSSRFSIGSSFKRANKSTREEELPIQENSDFDENQKPVLQKFNHRIIVSDVVFKNRWSSVSSSDLVFLNSEMLAAVSNDGYSPSGPKSAQPAGTRVLKNSQAMKIKEEMEKKRVFESKLSKMSLTDSLQLLEKKGKTADKYDSFSISTNPRISCIENVSLSESAISSSRAKPNSSNASRALNPADKRSMSEITAHPRFIDFGVKNSIRESSSLPENDAKEERLERLWLPIARRTVQWFANRERRSHRSDNRIQSSKV